MTNGCSAAGIKIITSSSETLLLSWKWWIAHFGLDMSHCPKWRSSGILGEGRMDQAGTCSTADPGSDYCGEESWAGSQGYLFTSKPTLPPSPMIMSFGYWLKWESLGSTLEIRWGAQTLYDTPQVLVEVAGERLFGQPWWSCYICNLDLNKQLEDRPRTNIFLVTWIAQKIL